MKRRLGGFGVLGCILLACGGTDGSNGQNALLDMGVEPPGASCPKGGTRVRTGLDANGNGVLEDTEVTSTSYVCNGAAGGEGPAGPKGADGKDGKNGIDGLNGLAALMTITSEPAGTNCAAGGKKIDAGMDDDKDGVLDPGEIDQTTYVCNGVDGAPGLNVLVSVTSEPAGTSCPTGGQKIESGIDDDKNGTLDATEIDQTSFVCNGSNGSNGTDGLISAVKVSDEAWGANCKFGGKKLETGLDDDKNGVLDASEVDQTAYVCNGSGCQGEEYKNACWYIGGDSESCTSVCTLHGGYDEATRTIAGTDGTLADCASVLGLLGFPGAAVPASGSIAGIGCGSYYGTNIRYTSFATSADAAFGGMRRACACGTAPPSP